MHPLQKPLIIYHSKTGKQGLVAGVGPEDIDFSKPFEAYLLTDDGNIYQTCLSESTFPGVYNGTPMADTQMLYYVPLPVTNSVFLKYQELIKDNNK